MIRWVEMSEHWTSTNALPYKHRWKAYDPDDILIAYVEELHNGLCCYTSKNHTDILVESLKHGKDVVELHYNTGTL